MTLSISLYRLTLSLPLPFLAHFKIATVYTYFHPHPPPPTTFRSTPLPPSAAAESLRSQHLHLHLPHPLLLSLPLSTLSHPSSPFIAIAVPTHLIPPSHTSPTISLLPHLLPLNLVLQCLAVVADPSHEFLKLICPYMGMDYPSCFSCVIFSYLSCYH